MPLREPILIHFYDAVLRFRSRSNRTLLLIGASHAGRHVSASVVRCTHHHAKSRASPTQRATAFSITASRVNAS